MKDEKFFIDNLRTAICKQAAKDYVDALKKNDEGKAKTLEKWFVSPYGQLMSGGVGECIIKKSKEIAEERKNKKCKKKSKN